MRKIGLSLLAGVAVLGLAGAAIASGRDTHTLAVDLPDGSIAKIEYQGEVAPRVTIGSRQLLPLGWLDTLDGPIARLQRLQAGLEREADQMLRHASALAAGPVSSDGNIDPVTLSKLPRGTVTYSFVSSSDGKRTCTRSWEVTSSGVGATPKVISNTSGDCKRADRMPAPAGFDTVILPRSEIAAPASDLAGSA